MSSIPSDSFFWFASNDNFEVLYLGEEPYKVDLPPGFWAFKLDLDPVARGLAPLPIPVDHPNSLPVARFLLNDMAYNQVDRNVMMFMEARRQLGINKYGTELKTHNGRPVDVDIQQEAGDLMMYLKQAELEGQPLSELTLNMLCELKARLP